MTKPKPLATADHAPSLTPRKYLASIGRRGGRATSARKTAAVRKNGRKGGRPPTRRAVILDEYRDSDGYWINLRDGFQNGSDPGTHAIHEDTKTAAYSKLSMVRPCACAECLDRIANAQMAAAVGTK